MAESLAMELRDSRRSNRENVGDVAQRYILEVVKDHDSGFGFRQLADGFEEGAAALGVEHGLVGPFAVRIGKTFGQREVFLAVEFFVYFIEGNKMAVLDLGLEAGEFVWLDAKGGGQFGLSGFTVQLIDKLGSYMCDTPPILMNGAGRPVPSAQLIEHSAADANRTEATEGSTLGEIVTVGSPEVTEYTCALKVFLIEMSGKFGGAGSSEIPSPREIFEQPFLFVSHNGLLCNTYYDESTQKSHLLYGCASRTASDLKRSVGFFSPSGRETPE
jgi:hypothetical protein